MSKVEHEDRLNDILKKRLLRFGPEELKSAPSIFLEQDLSWFIYNTDTYYILALSDVNEQKRIKQLLVKKYHPFPGLIVDRDIKAAFRINAKNMLFHNCSVENRYSFLLEKDTTMVLWNHTQSITTIEEGPCSYVIGLAYIISFGDEINKNNLYDFLDDLIAYSVEKWKLGHDKYPS